MSFELSYLLNPQSVAIVGVSEHPGRIGGRLFRYLLKHGYQGSLALVNPKYEELETIRCYPSLSEVPFPLDCALIAVSGRLVPDVLQECAEKGVRAAIIFSSGFAEMGQSGAEAQHRIAAIARENSICVCGPNCIGLINFQEKTALCFSQFLEVDSLAPGPIGFISQSGALGGSLVNRAQDMGIGFSSFISSGNEAVLDIADYIQYLALSDQKTEVITAVIEGFRDGPKFIAAAQAARSQNKPLIVYKIGETEAGQKAAASHTGSITGSDAVMDAVFEQNGVIRVQNYDDLFQTAALLAKGKIPKGNRIGILTSTGGGGIIMADAYTKLGLQIPQPSQDTQDQAEKEIAAFGRVANPFDLTGQIFSDPELFQRCMKLFAEEDQFDILQVNVSMVAGQSSEYRARMLLESIEGCDKPVVSWWAAGSLSDPGISLLRESDVAVFRSPDRCARAVKALVDYGQWFEQFSDSRSSIEPSQLPVSTETFEGLLKSGQKNFSEHQSKKLLQAYGIPVTRERLCTAHHEILEYAEEIGLPLVLKVDSPDILHKSEAGLVHVGVASKDEVPGMFDGLLQAARTSHPQARIHGILVQEMVQGGREVMIGMSRDAQFGPTIAFGLGGIHVEVLKDIALRLPPLTPCIADEMIREINGYQILEGVRGSKPADLKALVDVLVRLSRLVEDWKETLSEIDINPLVVFDEGQGVKALDALIVGRPPQD